MGEPSAEQLLAGLAAGQEWAFAALYRQFGRRLFRTAYTMLGRADLAEDAVQDVFVALVRSRRSLAQVESLSGYVFASLRRAVSRIGARQAREARTKLESIALGSVRLAECDAEDERGWLREALKKLPAQQRELIGLKIDGELTFAQIAALLDISPNTAASRYRYALETLRELAQERNESER